MGEDFVKLQGAGNDFIVFDGQAAPTRVTPGQVRALTDRHFGVGGDGVIVVEPGRSAGSAGYMHYVNADGSLAQMCGNGVRCVAKFLADRGRAGDEFVVDTLAGPKPVRVRRDPDGLVESVTVHMGKPVLDPASVPVSAEADAVGPDGVGYVGALSLDTPWGPLTFTCVSMGNPHAVTFPDFSALGSGLFDGAPDLDTLDVDRIGAYLCAHDVFPEQANIEFVSPREAGLAMRVFERGVGETLACGTGACAVGVAHALAGGAREVDVRVPGGDLRVRWDADTVWLTGPVREVFTGHVDLS